MEGVKVTRLIAEWGHIFATEITLIFVLQCEAIVLITLGQAPPPPTDPVFGELRYLSETLQVASVWHESCLCFCTGPAMK